MTLFINLPDEHLASSNVLREDEEREEDREDGQQQGKGQGDGASVAARSRAGEVDEARQVAGDVAFDPGLVLRHAGVDSWVAGFSTALSETHHSTQDPLGFVGVGFTHQGAAGIPLNRSHQRVTG